MSEDARNVRAGATTNLALVLAAIGEAATGLALLVAPSSVAKLLLGVDLQDPAPALARVAGIALLGLGMACWPGPPRLGMLTYSLAVAVYLAWLALVDGLSGVLLWPAVLLHAAIGLRLTHERVVR